MMINVLIFPAGTEIGLEILNALKHQKDIKVFGATSAADHSELVYRRLAKGLPYFYQEGFISELNRVIDEWGIDFVYPARDDVQLYLTENAERVRARVVTSSLDTVRTCRSKARTYEKLAGSSYVPSYRRRLDEICSFPVFAKPDVGEGSKGARRIDSRKQGEALFLEEPGSRDGYIFCEYLPGREYTVDCLTSKDGALLSCSPRTRLRTQAGISVRSARVTCPEINKRIRAIAEDVNHRIEFEGAWFFQLKERGSGDLALLEVSPRIPGTMGLSRNCGVNYPLLTLYVMLNRDIAVETNDFEIMLDKALVSRYRIDYEFRRVYIDYDDTICINNKVSCIAITFLYQCCNKGIEINLITRHDGDILEELMARNIASSMFDSIIQLDRDKHKSQFIDPRDAIFIDDSFSERREVGSKLGIPVFDIGNIEALIDWTEW